jgi:hypothetical protein
MSFNFASTPGSSLVSVTSAACRAQRIALTARHSVEREAHHFENGCFADPTRSDDAVETVGELDVETVEEPSDDAQPLNEVMRSGA